MTPISHTPLALAKISRPEGNRPVARPRLFERLDALRRFPVVWIAGAPGAGKTTLASSYLAERGLAHLWYQLDADDADVATFFYYLGLAVRQATGRGELALPLLTPEYMPGLISFTRRYAETLAGLLASPAVLVLDNYEQLPTEAPLHDVVRELAACLPRGMNLLVLSRTEPPAACARLRLNEALVVLDGQALNLTPDEAAGLAAQRIAPAGSPRDPSRVNQLLLETGGWLAGFTLLVDEGGSPGPGGSTGSGGRTQQLLFDYFATELFERFEPALQDALLRTAPLPSMTVAQAEQISGDPAVGGVLADLHRRNCFVVLRRQDPPTEPAGESHHAPPRPHTRATHQVAHQAAPQADTPAGSHADGDLYEYHALFRAFLLSRAAARFPAEAWRALQGRAADVLAHTTQADAAAELYRAAQDTSGLAALALRQAPALISAGRHHTLARWLSALPDDLFGQLPWLHHWRAAARLPFDPLLARSDFERAYAGFQRQGDAAGQYATWAGAMESFFFEWSDFSLADGWIAEFEHLRARHPEFPSRAAELRTYWAMGTLLHRQPQHPLLPAWSRRALALLAPADRDLSVLLGGYLIIWFLWRGETHAARSTIERIASWILPTQSPMVLILWSCALALHHSVRGDMAACRGAVEEGLALAERSGLQGFDFLLCAQMARCALVAGALAEAPRWIARVGASMRSHSRFNGALYCHLHSNAAAQMGDWQQALDQAHTGLAMALESGVPFLEAHCHIDLARAQLGNADRREWAGHIAAARSLGCAMQSRVIEYLCLEAEALAAFEAGEEAAGLGCLRQALALSRVMDGATWLMAGPRPSARLYDRALSAGIETDHVQRLIRRQGLAPPEPATAGERWPWPVRVYTLGRFEILLHGEPLRASGKAQNKPLELLKYLCAHGGQAVHQDPLTDALWPDSEGDAADQALRTTLHRLRKLLQHEQAVRLEARQLHLDPRWLWADCLAFDHAAQQAQRADRATLQRVFKHYRGPFLSGDSAPWALACRDRLQAQALRVAERLGALLEREGDDTGAVDCYLRAIEIEPTAEPLYRHLMSAYARLERQADALAAYQRCRQALLSHRGVGPAAQTQALYQQLASGH